MNILGENELQICFKCPGCNHERMIKWNDGRFN